MRRISTAMGLLLVAVTAIIGLGAPANAVTTPPPPWTLHQTFGWPDACSSAGNAGEAAGQWSQWLCDEIAPAGVDGPGIYDLYVITG